MTPANSRQGFDVASYIHALDMIPKFWPKRER